MVFATALVAAGVGMQAYSAYAEGQAASDDARAQARITAYNAAVSERNARAVEMKTTFDQVRQAQRGRRIMGSLRAKLGASGALMDEGAPLSLQADQLMELELENALIGYEGSNEASKLRAEGALSTYQGNIFRQKAKNAETAGLIGTGSTLLSGFGKMKSEGMFA